MAKPFDGSNMGDFLGFAMGILSLVILGCFLWAILVFWPHQFGWHGPLDWMLPAKIQGLYGVKLDEPFVDESAVREGDCFKVLCEGKPCKSINVEVADLSGRPYVISIHVESDLGLGKVLCLLKEKYDRDPEGTDNPYVARGISREKGTPRKISDVLGDLSVGVHSKYYIFRDWRSGNFITVEVIPPTPIKSFPNDPFAQYDPFTQSTSMDHQLNHQILGNAYSFGVVMHAYGKLYLKRIDEAESKEQTEWNRQRDEL